MKKFRKMIKMGSPPAAAAPPPPDDTPPHDPPQEMIPQEEFEALMRSREEFWASGGMEEEIKKINIEQKEKLDKEIEELENYIMVLESAPVHLHGTTGLQALNDLGRKKEEREIIEQKLKEQVSSENQMEPQKKPMPPEKVDRPEGDEMSSDHRQVGFGALRKRRKSKRKSSKKSKRRKSSKRKTKKRKSSKRKRSKRSNRRRRR